MHLFTNRKRSTPDANFLITEHPEHPNLYIAGGASAHGFKVSEIT